MNPTELRRRVIQQTMDMVRGGGLKNAVKPWAAYLSASELRVANPGTLLKRLQGLTEQQLVALVQLVRDAYDEWAYQSAALVGERRRDGRLTLSEARRLIRLQELNNGAASATAALDQMSRMLTEARGAAMRGEWSDVAGELSGVARGMGQVIAPLDKGAKVLGMANSLAAALANLSTVGARA
jgi:hypothetical protein